jgi:hypothetical protein
MCVCACVELPSLSTKGMCNTERKPFLKQMVAHRECTVHEENSLVSFCSFLFSYVHFISCFFFSFGEFEEQNGEIKRNYNTSGEK